MELRNLIITLCLLFGIGLGAFAADDFYNHPTHNTQVQNAFADYMTNVKTSLRTNWQPPDFMEEGHVRILFRVNRYGNVISYNIIESSGDNIYDESAVDAIRKSEPFGNFPNDTLRESIAINYAFDTILIEEERMKGCYELAKRYAESEPDKALGYLNRAIAEVGGEEASYFLYKRRAEIKQSLGDYEGAKDDFNQYQKYTNNANIKRVHLLKHLADTENSAYIYYYLAFAYAQINDYDNALTSINTAIEKSDSNNYSKLKKYKTVLEQKFMNEMSKNHDNENSIL